MSDSLQESDNTLVTEGESTAEGADPNTVLTEGADDTASQETDSQGDAETAKEEAPETYEFQFPEGVEKDEVLVEAFTPIAKELNLTQEKAQKLVDFYNKHVQDQTGEQTKAWEDMQKEWVTATKSDKDIGGVNFVQNLAVAKKAVDTFGSNELKQLFNYTGVGNHVAMVKFLHNIGKAISESKIYSGQQSDVPKDVAKILFPDMN